MNKAKRKAEIEARFSELYGTLPTVWGRAPGRVDLMGSHTDYNMGSVMTMTIDQDTWIAAAPRADRQITVHSLNLEGGATFSLDSIEFDETRRWTNYIRGMAKVLQEEGLSLGGMNALVHSTIPIGSGLSSSAAIEMAMGVVFQQMSGFQIEPVRMAVLGQRAENQFVGVNCGILDQYSAMMGQENCSLLLTCCDLISELVPMAEGIQVMICDTRSKRNLAGTEYGERRAQCEEGARILSQFDPRVQSLCEASLDLFYAHQRAMPPVVAKRCQFILEENQRVTDVCIPLSIGDYHQLGKLYQDSFTGARDLYEICSPSMQIMMDAMVSAPGMIGARQAGAGFGGCMVALVEPDSSLSFAEHVKAEYQRRSGIKAGVYPVNPSKGAGPIFL